MNDPKGATIIINDKAFAEDIKLTVSEKVSDGIYAAELSFSLAADLGGKDNLSVALTYVDANGVEQTLTAPLTG